MLEVDREEMSQAHSIRNDGVLQWPWFRGIAKTHIRSDEAAGRGKAERPNWSGFQVLSESCRCLSYRPQDCRTYPTELGHGGETQDDYNGRLPTCHSSY